MPDTTLHGLFFFFNRSLSIHVWTLIFSNNGKRICFELIQMNSMNINSINEFISPNIFDLINSFSLLVARFKDRRKGDEEPLKSARELIHRFPFVVFESFSKTSPWLTLANCIKSQTLAQSKHVSLLYIDGEKKMEESPICLHAIPTV